jgi:hypothetical protein
MQEVDLAGDEVIVGRGPECQITIDDPMLSRRHARIDLSGAKPAIEDLRSRNGTQLNGRPLVGRAVLEDGDRIRLGTQELVFVVPGPVKRKFRTTSGLRICTGCAVPYPSTSVQCPHCGAVTTENTEIADTPEVTASGWTFQLLAQVILRALEQGRLADAERMLARGIPELEEQLEAGVEVEPERLRGVAQCAARLGCALRSERWLTRSAALYDRSSLPPSRDVLALVDALPTDKRLSDAVNALRQAGSHARQAS